MLECVKHSCVRQVAVGGGGQYEVSLSRAGTLAYGSTGTEWVLTAMGAERAIRTATIL